MLYKACAKVSTGCGEDSRRILRPQISDVEHRRKGCTQGLAAALLFAGVYQVDGHQTTRRKFLHKKE
jgi:hypothetical protein